MFNQAVTRNSGRFPESFCFKLTREEPAIKGSARVSRQKTHTKTMGLGGFLGKRRREGPGIVFVCAFATAGLSCRATESRCPATQSRNASTIRKHSGRRWHMRFNIRTNPNSGKYVYSPARTALGPKTSATDCGRVQGQVVPESHAEHVRPHARQVRRLVTEGADHLPECQVRHLQEVRQAWFLSAPGFGQNLKTTTSR
ncbi:hypothetical protein HMPREF1503_0538 [Olsenella uli MSTE5]|nr:hypothetical protein HMPREF1503_0538 [Olsenella uli MSTE5]